MAIEDSGLDFAAMGVDQRERCGVVVGSGIAGLTAAVPAVASRRASPRHELLPPERDATVPAVAYSVLLFVGGMALQVLGCATIAAGTTEYRDGVLDVDVSYSYRIRATNAAGGSF